MRILDFKKEEIPETIKVEMTGKEVEAFLKLIGNSCSADIIRIGKLSNNEHSCIDSIFNTFVDTFKIDGKSNIYK